MLSGLSFYFKKSTIPSNGIEDFSSLIVNYLENPQFHQKI
jgi:hypothetical protein